LIQAAQLVAEVKVTGDEEAKSKLSSVGKKVDETGHGFSNMLKGALSFAAGQAIFNGVGMAVGFLGGQLKDAFQQSMDAQAGMEQTNKVLQSTHDVSRMSAQGVADLAGNLSHLTKFSDDTVQASENMLLTFTNIGKKGGIFDQATKTTLDMSQALGQDTKSSAIQLGKALNDPIAGISALSRVGVTFDDKQKELIKTYMAHNNIAKAQGVILKELQKEFGGSAVAAGKTFGGQLVILGQYFDDLKQNIADTVMPVLIQLAGWFTQIAMPALQQFGDQVVTYLSPIMAGLGDQILYYLQPALGKLGDWVQHVGLPTFLKFSHWFQNEAMPIIKQTGQTVLNNLLPPLKNLFSAFGDVLSNGNNSKAMLQNLSGVIITASNVLGPLINDLAQFVGWMNKGGPATQAVKVAIVAVGVALAGVKVVQFGKDVVSTFNDAKKNVTDFIGTVGKIKDKLGDVLGFFKDKFSPGAKTALDDVGTSANTAKGKVAGIGTAAVTSETEVAASSASEEVELTAVGTSANTAKADIAAIGPASVVAGATGTSAFAAFGAAMVSTAIAAIFAIEAYMLKDAIPAVIESYQNPNYKPPTGPGGVHPARHATGIFDNPVGHMAMMGEGGEPEVVTGPRVGWLPRGASVIPMSQWQQQGSAGQSKQPVQIIVNLAGRRVANTLLPDLHHAIRYGVGGVQ
jgi:hypothetical protein